MGDTIGGGGDGERAAGASNEPRPPQPPHVLCVLTCANLLCKQHQPMKRTCIETHTNPFQTRHAGIMHLSFGLALCFSMHMRVEEIDSQSTAERARKQMEKKVGFLCK